MLSCGGPTLFSACRFCDRGLSILSFNQLQIGIESCGNLKSIVCFDSRIRITCTRTFEAINGESRLVVFCTSWLFHPPSHRQRSRVAEGMSSFRRLDLQFNLSKSKILRKPSRFFSSSQSRQSSGSIAYQPNIEELKKVFNKFDSNRDGKISQQEYKAILRALGKEATIEEVPCIFRAADLDGDGFIDFNEFVEAHKHGGGIRSCDIQSAFGTFDLNGDGRITAEEVLRVLRSLGERCNLEDCRRMVRAVDTDGDGAVNLDEFMSMMTRTLKI